jgi:hypothetical protein
LIYSVINRISTVRLVEITIKPAREVCSHGIVLLSIASLENDSVDSIFILVVATLYVPFAIDMLACSPLLHVFVRR